MKCFQTAKEHNLYELAHAFLMADTATKNIVEIDAQLDQIKQGVLQYSDMNKGEKRVLRKKLKRQSSQGFT